MNKDTYRRLNEHIAPSPGLNRRVLEKTVPRRRLSLRPAVALVLVLVLIFSAPRAMANPDIYQLMHGFSPEFAARFAPVLESCENNGIRMEVVTASVHDNTAAVYITFEDLEGNRLNEHTYPWLYSIQDLRDYSSTMSANYDQETGTVACLIELNNNMSETAVLEDDRITFFVEYLERNETDQPIIVPVPIALTDSAGLDITYESYTNAALNEPVDETLCRIQEGYDVTCMTVIDGKLHVQTRISHQTASGYFALSLSGPQEEPIPMDYGYSFYDGGVEYDHRVFDLAGRAVEDCTLTAEINPVERIKGPWRVTFDLDQVAVTTEE